MAQDEVIAALEALEAALEENIARNKAAIARSRKLRAARAKGKTWRELVAPEHRPLIVELMTKNLQVLQERGSELRRAEARALHDEGLTMEQIAELFGVTRQRISSLLRSR